MKVEPGVPRGLVGSSVPLKSRLSRLAPPEPSPRIHGVFCMIRISMPRSAAVIAAAVLLACPPLHAAEEAGSAKGAAAKPDLERAAATAKTVCAACHGADGNSGVPANPSIAG